MSRLIRFLEAQADSYESALSELNQGRKVGHWMWYIFPQIRGLGHSSTSQYYAIEDLTEAREYLSHPTLGKRLLECTTAVCNLEGKEASEIFGYPDVLKFRSCLTLFSQADSSMFVFSSALDKFFKGDKDYRTLQLLKAQEN